MSIPQYRIFFDTSVYIAAMLSSSGAAGELIRLVEAGIIRMVVSQEVIVEADRVLNAKFPELVQESRKLWKDLNPELTPEPSLRDIKLFLQKLPQSDALILGAAHQAKVAAFVTWNTRDFMGEGVSTLVDFPIVVPGDCLKLFRKWIDPFLR